MRNSMMHKHHTIFKCVKCEINKTQLKVDIKRIETDIEKIRNLYNKGYQDGKLALI